MPDRALAVLALGTLAAAPRLDAPTRKPAAAGDRDASRRKRLGIGREAKPEEIAGWDIDVRPDGQGLPPGKGTVKEGETIYMEHCAACHGEFGESAGRWPILTRRRRHAGEQRSGQIDRLVLALRLDRDGLHPPRHAVRQRPVAQQ